MDELLTFLRQSLPEVFPGKDIDRLTSRIFRWRTLQNQRSRGEFPEDCFIKLSPRKVLILRDRFLAWVGRDWIDGEERESSPFDDKTCKVKPP